MSARALVAAAAIAGAAWPGAGTGASLAAAPRPTLVVMYAKDRLGDAPALAARGARYVVLEGFRPAGLRADTVILGGHSRPPAYLGRPPAEVAGAIASFRPSLVVLETCYGASTPILAALAATGLRAWVVAPPYRLPIRNLSYGAAFFTALDPAVRAAALDPTPPFPLLRWRLDPRELAGVETAVGRLGPDALRARLKRVAPTLVRMPLPSRLSPRGEVLVPVPAERFTRPSAPRP